MYSRWIVLSIFFTFIWVEKGVFIFQTSLNVRSIETIDSSLHYHNCYQYFIFTIVPLLSQH